jgi:hypothetical protein
VEDSLQPDFARYFIAIIPSQPIFDEVLSLKNYFKEKYNSKGLAEFSSAPDAAHAVFVEGEKRNSPYRLT